MYSCTVPQRDDIFSEENTQIFTLRPFYEVLKMTCVNEGMAFRKSRVTGIQLTYPTFARCHTFIEKIIS